MKTILFLHGWGGDEKSFAAVEGFFRANCNCIFVRFPCFRRGAGNDNPDRPWTLDDYADLVIRTLDEKQVQTCNIIAHSFGARVAVLLASKYPRRFEKLVLAGPAGIPKRFSLRLWIKIKLYKFRKWLSRGRKSGLRRQPGVLPRNDAGVDLESNDKSGSSDYKVLDHNGKITFQNIIGRDLRPEIRHITTPTLVIWGRRDRAVRRYMVKLWTKLNSNTKLVIYRSAGHFCFIDAPTRFIIDVQEFINV